MLNTYSPIESIVASLKFGHVNGKYFSTQEIADFLSIESQEVADITKKILLDYKERINQIIDSVIQIATENPTISSETHVKELHI